MCTHIYIYIYIYIFRVHGVVLHAVGHGPVGEEDAEDAEDDRDQNLGYSRTTVLSHNAIPTPEYETIFGT